MSQKLHVVALGCPKNRVDSERMVGLAQNLGFQLTPDPAEADAIVVNTCGFIRAATEESIDTVLELARHKQPAHGRCKLLVVAGCLAQRYAQDLPPTLPEVDHFIGTDDLPRLAEILAAGETRAPRVAISPVAARRFPSNAEELYDRALVGSPAMAYLKIAEGCDRRCAFCIIPALRGPQRSRTPASLVHEAEQLAATGVRELVLVAQDSTAYGRDLEPRSSLAELLEQLQAIEPLRWIRVLYAYPSAVDQPLRHALATLPKVVPYLDVPLQHVDDRVLRAMHRGYDGRLARKLLEELREDVPGIYVRSTFLVGHPGEDEAAHRALMSFVAEYELDHLGVFTFSAEEGTPAAGCPEQVPARLARRRARELIELQREISQRKLARLRGQQLVVLIEGPSVESEYLVQARHAGQAPEVDGVVVLSDCAGQVQPGQLLSARVTDSGDYDLVATLLP